MNPSNNFSRNYQGFVDSFMFNQVLKLGDSFKGLPS